jgi:hypothetical protein
MSELSEIRKSVCDRIADNLEDLVNDVTDFRDGMRDEINRVASDIMNSVKPFDPYEERNKINKAIADINKNMEKIVPAVKDFNEILDILEQCFYLQVDTFLRDPVTLVNQIADHLKSNAMDVLFGITDLIEMTLAKTMQDLVDLIPSVEITGFEAYNLIQCLGAMCGRTDLTSSYARLHNAFEDLCMNGVGRLDVNRWYAKGGLYVTDPVQLVHIENMNMGISTINGVYRSIESNSAQAVEVFKSLPITF